MQQICQSMPAACTIMAAAAMHSMYGVHAATMLQLWSSVSPLSMNVC